MPTDPNQGKRPGTAAAPPARSTATAPRLIETASERAPAKGADLGRQRALVAWTWVTQAEAGGEKRGGERNEQRLETFRKRYGTLARKLPSLLQVSGLGQTLAFLFSKGGTKREGADWLLFSQLATHLRERLNRTDGADFMALVMELSPAEYRNATREAAAVAEWLKRFAEGRLGMEDA